MGDRGHSRQGPKRGGLLCLFRGELGPRLAQCCLGRRLLPYQVASSSIQPFGTLNMGQKLGGVAMPSFLGVYLGPHPSQIMSPWPMAYLHTKCHLSPSSRLTTTDIGRKLGGLCPFRGGEAGSPPNTKSPGLRPTSIPVSYTHLTLPTILRV